MSGPWVDWSRIEFNSEGNLIYSFYHTFFDTDIKNQAQGNFKKTFTGTIELYQNGKLVAVKDASINGKSRADFEIRSSNGYWTKFDYTLYKFPLDGAKKFYTQSDMKDGNYEIKLAMKDEKGGVEAKKFGFEMKNGKILPAEEADRTHHTDTKTLIDEGRDYHYLKAKQ